MPACDGYPASATEGVNGALRWTARSPTVCARRLSNSVAVQTGVSGGCFRDRSATSETRSQRLHFASNRSYPPLMALPMVGSACGSPQRSVAPRGFATANHLIVCSNFRASPNKSRICWRSAIASVVNRPCRRALWFPFCAPEPCAPPCMRQRDLPRTAAERHDPQKRVLAPQRGLVNIGRIFGAGLLKLVLSARGLSRPGNRARSFGAAGRIQLRCQFFRV